MRTIKGEFAEWLFSRGEVTRIEAARFIKDITCKKVNQSKLTRWVSQARRYLERERFVTIITKWKSGYKISTDWELAQFTARSIHRVIANAERTRSLSKIVDRRLFPLAIRETFKDAEKGVGLTYQYGRKFFELWRTTKMIKGRSNGK